MAISFVEITGELKSVDRANLYAGTLPVAAGGHVMHSPVKLK